MGTSLRIASSLLILVGAPAYAQTAASPDLPAAASVQSEVTPYLPAFFAPYNPVNAWDMISRIPGFSADTGSDVRGLSGAAGNILIDGERPPGKTDLGDILGRLRANQIARIDLIRGGAPGIDMQGKIMVINIIRLQNTGGFSGLAEIGTRYTPGRDRADGTLHLEGARELANGTKLDGRLSYNRVDGERGNPGERRVRVSPTGALISSVSNDADQFEEEISGTLSAEFDLFGGETRLAGTVDKSQEDELRTEVFDSGPPRLTEQTGEEDRREVEASYAYSLANGGRLQAVLTQNWSEEASDSISLSGRPPTGNVSEESGGDLGVTASYPLRPGLRLQSVFAKSWHEESSASSSIRSGGTLSSEIDNEESGETALRASVFYDPRESLSIEAGAEAAYNVLEGSSEIALDGTSIVVPGSQAKVDEKRGEAFAVATWRMRPDLTLDGALRYEFSTLASSGVVKKLSFIKPMAQARWEIGSGREILARVERTVGQLDFGDFLSSASISEFDEIITAGAVELTPTQDWVTSIQFDQRFWDTGTLRVEAEYHALSDVIAERPIVTSEGVFEGTGNIGDGRQAYLNAEADMPLDRLGVAGGRLGLEAQLLLYSDVTDPFTEERRKFGNDRDYEIELNFEQDVRAWNVTWGFSVGTNARSYSYRRNSIEVSRETPEFSAFVSYKPSSRSIWRLEAYNIVTRRFDRRREVYFGQRNITPANFFETRRNENLPSLRLTYRRTTG